MQPSISQRILERFFTELAKSHPDGQRLAERLRQIQAEEPPNQERAIAAIYERLGQEEP